MLQPCQNKMCVLSVKFNKNKVENEEDNSLGALQQVELIHKDSTDGVSKH